MLCCDEESALDMSKHLTSLLEEIEKMQNSALKDLKIRVNLLISSAQLTIDKIEKEGLKGYYSVNHDCMRHSSSLHRTSNNLYVLREMKEFVLKEIACLEKEKNDRKKENKKRRSRKGDTRPSKTSVKSGGDSLKKNE